METILHSLIVRRQFRPVDLWRRKHSRCAPPSELLLRPVNSLPRSHSRLPFQIQGETREIAPEERRFLPLIPCRSILARLPADELTGSAYVPLTDRRSRRHDRERLPVID